MSERPFTGRQIRSFVLRQGHLSKAQEITREYCETNKVLYTETTLVQSYGIVVKYLNRVGLAAGGDPFDCPAATQFGR